MRRIICQSFAAEEESLDKLESNTDKAVLAAGDSGVYRYDQYGALPYDNTSMYMGTNSTAYYFSLANSSISDFFSEMYLNTPWEQHYENLDGRTILDRLASVKYFVISGDNFRYLSYGYNKEKGLCRKGKKVSAGLMRMRMHCLWVILMTVIFLNRNMRKWMW